MIGIYKITNLKTGESYIGQSIDIDKRFKKHISSSDTDVSRAIKEYGIDNFKFEVLEECKKEELDSKEDYYILLYQSNKPGFGYNKVRGGQHNIGESNSNVKLTEDEVYYIRECYNNHMKKYDVYEKFKDKISKYYFSNLWEGYSWNNIHMDVYTESNINYYKRETSIGQNSTKSVFTDEEVVELRKRYVNESAREIYESVKDRCELQTLQMVLWGRHYSNLPIYDKRNKKWINN